MRSIAVVLALVAIACGGGEARDGDAGEAPDAGDAGTDAAFVWSDAGPRAECPGGLGEDCAACFDNVGRCCYDEDPDWEVAKAAMSASCGSRVECAACCDECAAMSCEELMAADACPNSV
jgi:hypothetical protein